MIKKSCTFLLGNVFVVFVRLGTAQPEVLGTPDVKMFVNSTQQIWTYYTTEPTTFYCKVDQMLRMSVSTIFFYRRHMDSEKERKEILEGTFDTDAANVMLVGTPAEKKRTNESLLYASPDQLCGIFKVHRLNDSTEWLELRVKDPSTPMLPDEECRNNFLALQQKYYTPYDTFCKFAFLPLPQK